MVRALVQTLRVRQWVKNLFVLAPLVFSRELGQTDPTLRGLAAFFLFCLLASAVYAINDVLDVERDRLHPFKRNRPVASGRLPVKVAAATAVGLIAVSLYAAALLGAPFAAVASAYLLLNLVYSSWGRDIVLVDVLSIAAGFVLRVLGGAAAIGVRPSYYLLACTFLLALFLALGKRLHEITATRGSSVQRSVLAKYGRVGLRRILLVTAVLTALAYVAYTLDPQTRRFFHHAYLPVTIPFALFGIARFLRLVRRGDTTASPTDDMLRDPWFLANLALWGLAVVALVYAV